MHIFPYIHIHIHQKGLHEVRNCVALVPPVTYSRHETHEQHKQQWGVKVGEQIQINLGGIIHSLVLFGVV